MRYRLFAYKMHFRAEAAVVLDLTGVVEPGNSNYVLSRLFANSLVQRVAGIVGVFRDDAPEAFQHFVNRLVEFGFPGVTTQHFIKNRLQLFINLAQKDLLAASIELACGPCGAMPPGARHRKSNATGKKTRKSDVKGKRVSIQVNYG